MSALWASFEPGLNLFLLFRLGLWFCLWLVWLIWLVWAERRMHARHRGSRHSARRPMDCCKRSEISSSSTVTWQNWTEIWWCDRYLYSLYIHSLFFVNAICAGLHCIDSRRKSCAYSTLQTRTRSQVNWAGQNLPRWTNAQVIACRNPTQSEISNPSKRLIVQLSDKKKYQQTHKMRPNSTPHSALW